MNLNGWQRLWIVTILLYGIAVAFFAFDTIPKAYNIERDWINKATDTMAVKMSEQSGERVHSNDIRERLYKYKNHKEIIIWLEDVAKSSSEETKVFSKELSKINMDFKNQLALLSKNQTNHFLKSFLLLWMIPSISLYLLGWLIGWIVRGFKKK